MNNIINFWKKGRILMLNLVVLLTIFPVFQSMAGGQMAVSYPVSYEESSKNLSYPLVLSSDESFDKESQKLSQRNEKLKNNKYKNRYIIKLRNNAPKSLKENKEKLKKNNDNLIISNDSNLKNSEHVEIIEEDSILVAQTLSYNDPEFDQQNYLKAIGFVDYLATNTPPSKTVAVIDSGVCQKHPDLIGRVLEGWNFVDNNSNTDDILGHGCMVSGAIAANSNNSIGIVGAAPNVKILPIKIVENDGVASYSNLVKAINYAIDNQVDIINISLGGLQKSKILQETIQQAVNTGIKVIASSGNTGNSEMLYPASYPESISVGSVENDLTVSSYSSSSEKTTLWTYGSNIISTKDLDYEVGNGTSLATALATAFIANGGEYKQGGVIDSNSVEIKPTFQKKLRTITEPITKLSFEVPESLNVDGFENKEQTDTLINWQKIIRVGNGESLNISVWLRDLKTISEIFTRIKRNYGCNDYQANKYCIVRSPEGTAKQTVYSKYFINRNSIIRVEYSNTDSIGFRSALNIMKALTLENVKLFNKIDLNELSKLVSIPTTLYLQGAEWCGGVRDPNYSSNAYGCCNSSNTGENDANCTWYAAYRRPDLNGIITLWPGGMFQQAKDAGVPTSTSTPVAGALIVWERHVGYVESFNQGNNTVTWSEQNCYTSNNPYNSSVTRSTFTPDYAAGNFLGYIYFKSSVMCNGSNVNLSNWNPSSQVNCIGNGYISINPESTLNGVTGEITINVN